jgi:hypothetical protein
MADVKKAKEAGDREAQKKAETEVKQATKERDRLAKERRAVETEERQAQARAEVQGEAPETAGIGGRRATQRRAAREKPITGDPQKLGTRSPGEATVLAPARRQTRLVAATNLGEIGAHHGRTRGFRTSDAPRGFGREGLPSLRDAMADAKEHRGGIFAPDPELMDELERAIQRDAALNEFFGERRGVDIGTLAISPENRTARMAEIARGYQEKYRKKLAPLLAAVKTGGQSSAQAVEEHAPRMARRLGRLNARVGTPAEHEAVITELANQDVGRFQKKLRKAYENLSTTNPDALGMVLGSAQRQAEQFQTAVGESLGSVVNVNAGARKGGKATGGGAITGGAYEQAEREFARSFADRVKGQVERAKDEEEPWRPVPRPPTTKEMQRAQKKPLTMEEQRRLLALKGADTTPWDPDESRRIASDLAAKLADTGKRGPNFGSPLNIIGETGPHMRARWGERAVMAARKREGSLAQKAAQAGKPLTFEQRGMALQEILDSLVRRDEGGPVDISRIRHTNQWKQMSLAQRKRQPFCTYCGTFGSPSNPLQADHIRDLSKGGRPFDPRNVTTACKNCNLRKRFQTTWAPPGRAEGGAFMDARKARQKAALLARIQDRASTGFYGELTDDDFDDTPYQPQPVRDWNNDPRVQKLRAMADQSVSPNEAEIAQRMLHGKGVPGYAEGGEIKHTGLLGRMVSRGTYAGPLPEGFEITKVGERGEELIVQGPGGQAEVIPHHGVSPFMARLRQGQLGSKDLTGRAEGGPVTFRGATGFIPEPRAVVNAQGMVQRVYVVNWPSGATQMVRTPAATPQRKNQATREAIDIVGDPGFGAAVAAASKVTTPKGALPTPKEVAEAQPPALILPSKDPAFLSRIAIERRQELGRGRTRSQAERADIAVALAESPVRAFTTAFSQVAQTLTGRGNLLRQAKAAQEVVAQTAQAEGDLANTRAKYKINRSDLRVLEERETTLNKTQMARLTFLRETVPGERQAVRQQIAEVRRLRAASEDALQPLGGVGQAIKNLAVGGLSAIGAGIGFTAAFTALNATANVGAGVISELADRTTGYRNSAAQLTETLAEQTRANQGNAKAATAAALAQSGLNDVTAGRIGGVLAGRAQGVAGNQALHQQIEQIAAARSFGIRPENLPPGFDTSLVRSTGGPLDLGILPGVLSNRSTFDELAIQLQQGRNNFLFGPENRAGLRQLNAKGGDPVAEALAGLQVDTFDLLFKGVPLIEDWGHNINESNEGLSALNSTLDDINKQAQKGGFAGAGLATSANAQAIQDTIDAFAEVLPADSPFLKQLLDLQQRGQGVALSGEINPFAALQFGGAVQKSGLTPSPTQIINQLTSRSGLPGSISKLDVTLRDIARRGAFQRETQLPAAQALAFAARPITPFMDPRLRPSGALPGFEDTEGTIGRYEAAFEKYAKFAEPAQARINAQVEKGRQTLQNWIGPDLLSDITDLGQDIRDVQLGISQRSLNLEVSQYNNEIRIATRQLNQAKDFTAAIKGNVKETIGGLQGQNYQLGRQLQLVQQELQQRQINLQLAVAGFQVAGETPEERAARQDAAQAEAQFAQRQLDLQKQMSSNEFTVGLKENANAVVDLSAQIELLRAGKSLAIDSFAAEEAIKAMEAELQLLEQEAQQRFETAVENEQVLLGVQHDIEEATGRMIDMRDKEFVQLVKAFHEAGEEAGKAAVEFVTASILAAYTTNAPTIMNQSGSPDERDERNSTAGTYYYNGVPVTPQMEIDAGRDLNANGIIGKATGDLFNTTGVTGPMVIGEAGRETVAILRNPREGSFGGFGGGITVNINLNGAVNMRSDTDIAILAQKIEERLSYRLAMTRR